ncbi:MAG: WS/DGAT/MGAT family O-acyltransferase [Myxococcota bacterium]|nr:hypothetical protein [Spirochaeta sp.]MAI24570.1 hypothetical protein [Spirochaeta sp.]RPG06040.1 MAG: wax ester/triacylglycerol synthase family O-acyltransferase [Proteobacteria bacterium TMED72]
MKNSNYERLSAQDNSFLLFETPKLHMHISSTLIYEAEALTNEEGGIDFDRIKRAVEGNLHRIPRYRQKLHFIPIENHAVWVDDKNFMLDYHVRHTALPKPGSEKQLKRMAARIMAQPLDRSRPLWEAWVIEGIEGNRFALIIKIHHCMIDGSSGVDLIQNMMTMTPDRTLPEAPAYIPRPRPSRSDLMLDEIWRRASLPLRAFNGMRAFADETDDLLADISSRANILWKTLGTGLTASETPMNGPPSHHRKFDWFEVSLDDIKALRRGLDCSVNDVVLAVVTGAIREFLLLRGVDPSLLSFKVSAPVSVRKEEEKGKLGNRVSSWVIELPIQEPDPIQQLQKLRAVTRNLKETNRALGISMIMKVAEWTPASLLSLGSQATSGPINSIVTNVPGPQFPLYLQGAKLLSVFPQVPLLGEMGVGIALMSYDGKVCWGFNANPDVIPDLDVFVTQIRKSLDTLTELCAPESEKIANRQTHAGQEDNLKVAAVKSDPIPFPTQRNGSEG